MIQSNYFTTNEDLKEFFYDLVDWREIVPLYENQFSDAREYEISHNSRLEMAPSSTEEALSFYEEVLKTCGDISGNYVSQVASICDSKGLKFSNGYVEHPQEMVDAIQMYFDAGLGPVAFKRKFGGLGVPNIMKAMLAEIMYRSDSSITIAAGSMGLAAILEVCASESMQESWIPKIISENYTVTMGLSEPDFGSDLPNIKTKAIQKDGKWYLSGTKRYQTMACGVNGGKAVTLTLARTGSPESGARGLSFFLVENQNYKIEGIEKKLGIKASATCETVFEESEGYLVGKEGMGLVKYVMGMLNGARLSVSSQGTGIATAAFEEASKYAKERIQFGKPISEIPAVKKLLDRMEREIAGMRCLMVEAALSVDQYYWYGDGRPMDEEKTKKAKFWEKVANTLTPISKYYNSETCNSVVYDGLQVLGGAGFTEDYDLARLYRDARITNIYDGTTQIQVNAAIGGIVSGMGTNGVFRQYLNHLSEGITLPNSLRVALDELEKIVEVYKQMEDSAERDYYSWEVVSSTARLVVSLLMEKAKAKSIHRKSIREEWCALFHIDTVSIVTGNRLRVENRTAPKGAVLISV